jgi:hypothetical protein
VYDVDEDAGGQHAGVKYDREYDATSTKASTMRAVRWRVRLDAYAGDLSTVVSAALNVAELAGRCAIRRDEYNGGEYNGDAVNDTEYRRTNRVILWTMN